MSPFYVVFFYLSLVQAVPYLVPRANPAPNPNGYDLFWSGDNATASFERVDTDANPPKDLSQAFIVWTHNPEKGGDGPHPLAAGGMNKLDVVMNALLRWISLEGTEITMVPSSKTPPACLADLNCNPADACAPLYACALSRVQFQNDQHAAAFSKCLLTRFPSFPDLASSQWQCGFNLRKAPSTYPCTNNVDWILNRDTYNQRKTDEKLSVAVAGGIDADGYFWEGKRTDETFSKAIGRQYLGSQELTCTLASPCTPDLNCVNIGSYTALAAGAAGKAKPLAHAYMTIASMKNINQQMHNQYSELKDAINNLALTTFNIDQFYPKKGQNFKLLNALAGLSGFLAVVGGFIPFIGPAVATTAAVTGATVAGAGAIAGGASSFISNSVASKLDLLDAQKKFADKVSDIYDVLITGWDDATTRLFKGETIGGPNRSFNLTMMMKEGSWVSSDALTPVSKLNLKLKKEILSRSIDQLWKVYSSNKMWVLFTDLQDGTSTAKCEAHTQGPQPSKYCADGGVYYTYNFIEAMDEGGGVGYPWGADKLESVGLSFKDVTQASVRSYRLSKSMNKDPFAFDYNEGTATFLQESLSKASPDAKLDLSEEAGRFAGSWTVPVCDSGTWGASWQVDYTKPGSGEYIYDSHAPCLCGPQGKETNAWAKAAGMSSFKTFWHRCTAALEKKDFKWPDGVTSVSYPVSDGGREYQVKKPGT